MSAQRLRRLSPTWVGLFVVLMVAAANFVWQLGSSSYYVDEVLALDTAVTPFHGLLHALEVNEFSPPAYFVFLHEWAARVGFLPEWVIRLPSVVAGVALVGAVYWLATLLCGRRSVALAAAGLTALSPYVLEYAQLAQGYVFVMLSCTCAVAACIEADRAASERRRGWWLAAGAASAVVALWLHYTAALLLVPLCVWVALRRGFTLRARAAFIAACAVAGAALIPLVVQQNRYHRGRPGVADTAHVTSTTVQRVFATPLDGRVDWLLLLGALVSVASLAWLLSGGRTRVAHWPLVAWLAVGVPVTLLVISLFGGHVMLTRYAAAGAPFMIVAIAAAALSVRPRAAGVAIGALALALAIGGLIASHRPSGFYLDARGVVRYIRANERPDDAVLFSSNRGSGVPLVFYGLKPRYFLTPAASDAYRQRRRVWVILAFTDSSSPASIETYLRFVARRLDYSVRRVRIFPGLVKLALALEDPSSPPS